MATTPPATPPQQPQATPQKVAQEGSGLDLIFFVVNLIFFLIAITMTLFGLGKFSSEISWGTLSGVNPVTTGVVMLIIQIWHVIMSIQIVDVDEQAELIFLSKFIKSIRPGRDEEIGVVYSFYGLCLLIRAPIGMMEKDIPTDPRFIWHGDPAKTDGKIPKGFFPPLFIPFAPNPNEPVTFTSPDGTQRTIPKDDPYHQRNTAKVSMSYGWSICNLRQLILSLGMKKNVIAKAQSIMDDTAVRTFTAIFSKITTAEAMVRLPETEIEIRTALEKQSKNWGIEVGLVGMKPIENSHDLNTSAVGVSIALQEKKALVTKSEGDREKLTNLGLGNANAEYDLLSARAEAEMDRAKVAATPGGQFVIAVEAVQRGLETAKAVIVPQDNLFGAVAGIQELLKQLPTNTTPPAGNPPNQPRGTQGATPPPTPQNPQPPPERRYGGKGGGNQRGKK